MVLFYWQTSRANAAIGACRLISKVVLMNKTLFVFGVSMLVALLGGCSVLGGQPWNTCPKVDASHVQNGSLKVEDGVTKKCQVMQVDLGVEPTTVVDQSNGSEMLLYPAGVYFLFDKQGTLIKHNLKQKSPG